MKMLKRILSVIVLTLTTGSTMYAGCLSQYNNYLNVCDEFTSGFRNIGCKMDAVVEYWDCVGSAITN